MPDENYAFVSRHPMEESMSCQVLNFSFCLGGRRPPLQTLRKYSYKFNEITPAELKNS